MSGASRRDALGRLARLGSLGALGALGLAPAALGGCGEKRDGRVTGALWYAYGGNNRKVLLSLLERFHAEQGRYRLVATYQGDYFEALVKVRTALLTGRPPALTHVVGEVLPYLSEAGVLEPLPSELSADLVPELSQAGTFVGGERRTLVGLPFNRSTPIAYLNGDVLRELGLSPPATWSELRAFAARATRRAGDEVSRWGFGCPIDWWFWVALVGQAGGELTGRVDGREVLTLGGTAGERALTFWQELVHEDRVMRPPPGRDYNAWQVTNTDFLSGKVAMTWTSTAFLRYLEDNAKGRFPVVAAPLPADVRRAVPTGGTFFVMPRGAPAEGQEAARAFLRFMARPDVASEWAQRTGYLSTSRASVEAMERDGFFERSPNDAVAKGQLASAVPWPWEPTLFRVQREVVQPRLERAVLLRASPADVMREARAAALED
jgi:sn-glycerol 3-phosphate transport system substrate-binding protein